jgi:hypothetical protein
VVFTAVFNVLSEMSKVLFVSVCVAARSVNVSGATAGIICCCPPAGPIVGAIVLPVNVALEILGEVRVLFVRVSGVFLNTKVSLASCKVHVRAAVSVTAVSWWVNPFLSRFNGSVVVRLPGVVNEPVTVRLVKNPLPQGDRAEPIVKVLAAMGITFVANGLARTMAC